ncbi:hypothetical protein CRENBAI_015260 [Crenichthys baileyi]|uniref:Uncharacterized protein n=1 Tax=Crenichthys baileyi TaxID=28760 RepID=A0AAV9SJZ7_9TELE
MSWEMIPLGRADLNKARVSYEIFEVEDFSRPSSPGVEGGFVEPSGPDSYQFELLAQGADSSVPEAGAVEAVEDRMGPVSER